MAQITIGGESFPVPEGTLLSDALLPRHTLETPCGGQGRCGKCRVRVSGAVSPPSSAEIARLTPQELAQGVRLACCAKVLGDCAVGLFHSGESQIRLTGKMPKFHLAPAFSHYGVALDIGTTTLAALLFDRQGIQLAQASCPNPQGAWGADVISRIQAALQGKGEELAAAVRGALSQLIEDMAAQAAVSPGEIDGVTITGNTVMLYLLTTTDPDCLSHAPFQATRLFGETIPAPELDLPCPNAQVYLPRCMSAFVGADITTALLASSICQKPGTRLLTDIGTNGEIALWHKGQLSCCSTAAGPAFEGAGLSMGMPGKTGAIDHVTVENGALRAHVLGGGTPQGVCGSGVIDGLACLLELDLLDETGLLEEDPAVLQAPVSLSQKDVRMVQLAKSAVCSGLTTLLRTAGVPTGEVEELAVAGGFGSYLNVASAGKIGLLPQELVPKVQVLGNAALSGAAMLLLNETLRAESQRLAESSHTVDLSANPVFLELYTDNMFF